MSMSETDFDEDDFDDEDLSAPPKKHKTIMKEEETLKKEASETEDEEEVQELSPNEYHTLVKQKQENVSPKVDKYSPIVRRQQHLGNHIRGWSPILTAVDGERIVWDEADEGIISTPTKRKKPTPLLPAKRRKKTSTLTGVGRIQRRAARVPARPKNHTLNLGNNTCVPKVDLSRTRF
jgi:hypothetical protein